MAGLKRSYDSVMLLFDVSEECWVAEIVFAAGADEGSFFAILLLAVNHGFSAKLNINYME